MILLTTMNRNELEICISGRLDTSSYPEFETHLEEWLNGPFNHLVLDCTGLSYISSSGLRVLLTIQKRMLEQGGTFSLFGLQPIIREIFDITGFSSIFSIYADRNAVPVNDSSNFMR